MPDKKLTGKITRERIRLMESPRPPEGIIEGYRALDDASGIISDVMDELGITGVVGASVLKPTIPDRASSGPHSRCATSFSASSFMKQRAVM